jgi:hypothetical protein
VSLASAVLVELVLVVGWSAFGLAIVRDESLVVDDASGIADLVDVLSELLELSSVDLGWVSLLSLFHPFAHL